MRARRAVVALGLLASGCSVDLGVTPDAGPCLASPDYFVSDVFPRYLDANRCGASRECHAFDGGRGYLRLRAAEVPPPTPGTPPSAWPVGWRENYDSAVQLLRCDQPLASRLLLVPEGQDNLHPPGPVVQDRAAAAMLFDTWVSLPR
jgi:hypothetical protein